MFWRDSHIPWAKSHFMVADDILDVQILLFSNVKLGENGSEENSNGN